MGFLSKFGLVGVIIAVAVVILVARCIIKKAFKLVGFLIFGILAFGVLSYFGLMSFITGM